MSVHETRDGQEWALLRGWLGVAVMGEDACFSCTPSSCRPHISLSLPCAPLVCAFACCPCPPACPPVFDAQPRIVTPPVLKDLTGIEGEFF